MGKIKQTFKFFARPPFRFAKRIARNMNLKKKRLIFVFSGRSEGWGKQLYKDEPVFRDTIRACNTLLLEMGAPEILSYFEAPAEELIYDKDLKLICITAAQLATIEWFRSNNVFPDAVVGSSMGEFAAAYAAGALTFKEVLHITWNFSLICEEIKPDYTFVLLLMAKNETLKICRISPVPIEIVYDDGPDKTLLACHKKDMDELARFLNTFVLKWRVVTEKTYRPYHTSALRPFRDKFIESQNEVIPKPLKCDFYSSHSGNRIVPYSLLDANYWYELMCTPVLFTDAIQSAMNTGYNTFLQFGPPAITPGRLNDLSLPVGLRVIYSYNSNSETESLRSSYKQINKIQRKKPSMINKNDLEMFEGFKKKFTLDKRNSPVELSYLMNHGAFHFLPQHNAWMALRYKDVDAALKQPHLFSSSVMQYDPFLSGAEPEVHNRVRGLLQPLFSAKFFNDLGAFTATTAREILHELLEKEAFDLVKDFADPLSKKVLYNFFGISDTEKNSMELLLEKYKNADYHQPLKEHFMEKIQYAKQADDIYHKLGVFVKSGELTLVEAATVLTIIWQAGVATTSSLLCSTIRVLINEDTITAQLSANPQLIPKFIEEGLRLFPSIKYLRRITTQPTVVAGQPVPSGTIICFNLHSANCDPDHFEDPYTFLLSRPSKRHLSFGSGIHQCIGMGIARTEAYSTLSVVLERITDLKTYTLGEAVFFTALELEAMAALPLFKSKF